MPVGQGGQELPYAGTPEMDAFIQQINQQPAIMQQLPPEAVAEVLKHLGLDKSDLDEVGEWMDGAADAASGKPPAQAQAPMQPMEEEEEEAAPPMPVTEEA